MLRIETSIHCIDQLSNGFLEDATNVPFNETFLGSELIVKAYLTFAGLLGVFGEMCLLNFGN